MYYKRLIDNYLYDWKSSTNRQPLIIRGARQIGKSTSIREYSKYFENFVEINFDKNSELGSVFNKDLNPRRICQELSLLVGQEIIIGKTLLFFDEIQIVPKAITSLRYFYEEMCDLHVIATGSLLEFALSDLPSFGIGRIQSIYMYGFSFFEFLEASNESLLQNLIKKSNSSDPIPESVHEKILDLFIRFQLIGGMPKAISMYLQTGSFLEVQKALNSIINEYDSVFSKYKKRIPVQRLSSTFRNIALQVGNKFSFKELAKYYTYPQIHECLELLRMAGLLIPVYHSSSNGIPLDSEVDYGKCKYLVFDSGIYLQLLNSKLSELFFLNHNDLMNKGGLVEMTVGLELIKNSSADYPPSLYYWQREKKGSQAEVDYVTEINNDISPIEIKSSGQGSMKSLHLFMEEKKSKFGFRISFENFGSLPKIKIVPVYASGIINKNNQNS